MKSLRKARDVLAVIAAEPGIGLSALARRLALPKSTAHRLLSALEQLGFIKRHEDGRYHAGPLIHEIAEGRTWQGRLIEIARPVMVLLRDRCDETVALHILKPEGWAPIAQVESTQELRRTITNLGTPVPLYAGAVGKLFLAYMTEGDRDRYLKENPPRSLTPYTPVNLRRLLDELAMIRRRGYSTSAQEVVVGVAGIAMPIGTGGGAVTAAIAVSGPISRFTPKALSAMRPALAEAVREVQRRLGEDRPHRNGRFATSASAGAGPVEAPRRRVNQR
jgi:IclR family acetate operon transcriptional repressor